MVKFPEATARKFRNVFACRKCKTKMRSNPQKIITKTLSCKRCGCKVFRPLRKIKVAAKA